MNPTVDHSCHTISPPSLSSNICLFLIGALLIFPPLIEGGTTHLAVMVIRLLVLLLIALYGIDIFIRKEWHIPKTPCGSHLALFLFIALISTLESSYKNQSAQWLLICLTYAALFYLAVAILERWQSLANLRIVVLMMAFLEALVAFWQVAGGQTDRVTGTFFNPNFLASYLAIASVFALAAILYSKSPLRCRNMRNFWPCHWPMLGYILVLATSLAAILATGSRGGAIALAGGTTIVVFLRFGPKSLIGLGLVVALAVLVPNPIRDRVISEHASNPMAYSRWQMWQGTAEEIWEHPFGVGIGLYQYVYPQMASPVEGEIIRYGRVAYTPHSEYVQVGVELGIIGLLVFLLGIERIEREGVRLLYERLTRQQRGLAVGLLAGTIVALIHAAMDSNFHEPALAILFAVSTAGIIAARKLSLKEFQQPWTIAIQKPAPWIAISVTVGGLLLVHVLRIGVAYQQYEAGGQLLRHQQFDQAVDRFQQAIHLDSGKSLYHHALAGAYFQRYQQAHEEKFAQESIREFQAAINLNPLDGRLYGLLAHVHVTVASGYLRAGAKEEGRRWLLQAGHAYEQAMRREPFVYTYPFELGHVFIALGQQDAAEQLWQKVTELEPNFLPARQALAQVFVQTGRREGAAEEYDEIMARQKRFSHRPLTPHESTFMRVDLSQLEQLITRGVSAT